MAKTEDQIKREEQERASKEIRSKRDAVAVDVNLKPLKVGNKIRFCSDCYRHIEGAHGEVLSIEKYIYAPEKAAGDTYSSQGGVFWLIKVKDNIAKETLVTLAELIEII